MNTGELRIGNLVIYEACTYEVTVINPPKLGVKAVNHDWGKETCGSNEVEGIPITTDFLKKNGFEMLNKAMPELWIKPLGGYRYIRYHSGVRYMDFEDTHSFQRVPWAIRYVHQMQNACIDYGIDIAFKA
jgi:hypothetical protein